jgi:predicted RNA polymerase sigma factor
MKLLEPSNRTRELRGVMTLRQRRTCTLAWSTNLSHEEIAASQGISLKAVSMRLYRARKRLRNAGIRPPCSHATVRKAAVQLGVLENV